MKLESPDDIGARAKRCTGGALDIIDVADAIRADRKAIAAALEEAMRSGNGGGMAGAQRAWIAVTALLEELRRAA